MARKSSINREKVQQKADKYIQRGKLLDGINELKLLVEDNPGDMNTVNKIGDLYVRLGKVQEAINEFAKIAESYCDDGFILKAIAIYKKINKLDPANIPIYKKLADLYLTQGLSQEAKSQYQVIAEHYFKEGKVRESLEVFGKVIELDPNNIKIRARVADIYQKEGINDKALHEYLVIGHKLVSKGMFKEALAVFDRARKIDDHNAHALKGMAVALTEEGQPDEAVPLLRELLAVDPQNLEMLELLAKNLLSTGQLPECEKVLGQIYEQDPHTRDRMLDLYRAYLRGNEVKSAFRCLEIVLPSIIAEGAVDAAIGYVRDVLKRSPRLIGALEALAKIHESRDDEVELLAVRGSLAEAYTSEGQKTQAAELYRQLAKADPMNTQYRARLQELTGSSAPAATPPPPRPAAPPAPAAAPRPAAPPATPAPARRATAQPPPPRPIEPEQEEVSFDFADEEPTEAPAIRAPASRPTPTPALDDYEEMVSFEPVTAEPAVEEVAMDLVDFSQGADAELSVESPRQFPDPFSESVEPEVTELAAGEVDEIQAMEAFEIEAADPVPSFDFGAPPPGRRAAPTAELTAEPEEDDEQAKFVAEHITEAEVFAKYGLVERAIEQLRTVTARYPESLDAHQRLKDLYTDKQDPRSAATEAILLSDLLRKRGDRVAAKELMEEAVRLAPDHPLLEQEVQPAPITPPPTPKLAVAAPRPKPAQPPPPPPPPPAPAPRVAAEPPPGPTPEPTPVPRPRTTPTELPRPTSEPVPPKAPAVATPSPPSTQPAPPAPPAPPAQPKAAAEPTPTAPAAAPKSVTKPRPSAGRKAEDMLASLEAQMRRPTPKVDPLKAVDALMSSIVSKAGKPRPSPPPVSLPLPEPPATKPTQAAPQRPLAAAPPPAPPPQAPPPAARAEESTELVDDALADVFGDEQRFMDLATDMNSDLASLVSDGVGGADEAPESDAAILNDIFSEFKKGVDEQLGTDDYETRYNLGIAYKEMGLVDEAIREFQVAIVDRGRAVECCSMLGLCFMEKGDPESAVTWYEKGLQSNGHSPEQILGLNFNLALAFEAMGDRGRALDAFRRVQSKSPNHRNVGERIRKLEAAP